MLMGCFVVVHIAASIPRDFTAPNAWDANTRLRAGGVRMLPGASLEAGSRGYVQQSITMVYPGHGEDWITEEMPLDSSPERAPIADPVIAMEQMVQDTPLEKLEWCILRGANFAGKDAAQENRFKRIHAGREVIACDGSNFNLLIHVLDLATAVAAAGVNASAGYVFNLTDEPIRECDHGDRLADSINAPR